MHETQENDATQNNAKLTKGCMDKNLPTAASSRV